MNRTQVYLPTDLRKKIDQERSLTGESLAEYLRQAAEEKLARDKKRKEDLKKLAKEVTTGVKVSGWEGLDVLKWQKEIRKDRE